MIRQRPVGMAFFFFCRVTLTNNRGIPFTNRLSWLLTLL
jgi:hypothetical protein